MRWLFSVYLMPFRFASYCSDTTDMWLLVGQAAGRSSAEYLHSRKLEVFLNRMPCSAAMKLQPRAKCHPGSPQVKIYPHSFAASCHFSSSHPF